jgi:NADPH:quinone reductase-like Zn-dependent oxidoreductase
MGGMHKMKAVFLNDYGPVENFQLGDAPIPKAGPDDVLVKVQFAGLRWGDIMARNGRPLRRHTSPFIAGQEAAGVIEEVGANVEHLNLMALMRNMSPYQKTEWRSPLIMCLWRNSWLTL